MGIFRRITAAALLAFLPTGCGYINFSKPMSNEEIVLRSEIRGYYEDVSQAFAAGNADALADLYDESIADPMTREQIRDWARNFFKVHGPAQFKAMKIDIDSIGHVSAVLVLTYLVDTRDGAGSFHGVERDHLLKHGRRWYVSSWEKLSDDRKH
ncbi:MAG: hypothetical protein HKL90_11325 [Elusimicrobia bacterium]|nr:hypothetical protein [Elusimicrobiota bacterium]